MIVKIALVMDAISSILNNNTKVILKPAVIYSPSGDLNHVLRSKKVGSIPSLANEYATFVPPYRVALSDEEIENSAPIEIRKKPNRPRNGLAATARAFSPDEINWEMGKLPTATTATDT